MRWLASGSGLFGGLVLVLTGCGGGGAAGSGPPPAGGPHGDYAAAVASMNAVVAISTRRGQVLAFACDGNAAHDPTFAEWFNGHSLDQENDDGAHLTLTVTSTVAAGRVTLKDGRSLDFSASAVDPGGQGGIYRSDQVLNGVPYLAGWVVLGQAAAGSGQGGAVVNEATGGVFAAPRLDGTAIAAGSVTDPKVGTYPFVHCRETVCS